LFDKLVDLIIQFARLFQFWKVVAHWEAGVRIRFGKYQATLEPGFHWMIPFNIDRLISDNVVTETMRTKPQSLTTKDGVAVVISLVITFTITDIKTFLLDCEGRNAVVGDSAYGATAAFIMKKTYAELIEITDIGHELAKVVRQQAKKYGAAITSVQVVDFARCESLRLMMGSEIRVGDK
jgi:regulator of protease activity HflC (stomatin/prohibitin superfamily)